MVKDSMSALVLVLAVAISLAAAVRVFRSDLPRDEVIDHVRLGRRLAKEDLSDQPRSSKLELARRLEQGLGEGYDWQADFDRLSPRDQERFLDNLSELMYVSILDKVDAYFALPPAERSAYLDAEIDHVMGWPLVAANRGAPLADRVGSAPAKFVEQVRQRYAEADPAQRQRMIEFATAAYQRWMARGAGRIRGQFGEG
ncbi:MAG: hypothetical protein WD278_01995 [Pirellulales bacterium]